MGLLGCDDIVRGAVVGLMAGDAALGGLEPAAATAAATPPAPRPAAAPIAAAVPGAGLGAGAGAGLGAGAGFGAGAGLGAGAGAGLEAGADAGFDEEVDVDDVLPPDEDEARFLKCDTSQKPSLSRKSEQRLVFSWPSSSGRTMVRPRLLVTVPAMIASSVGKPLMSESLSGVKPPGRSCSVALTDGSGFGKVMFGAELGGVQDRAWSLWAVDL